MLGPRVCAGQSEEGRCVAAALTCPLGHETRRPAPRPLTSHAPGPTSRICMSAAELHCTVACPSFPRHDIYLLACPPIRCPLAPPHTPAHTTHHSPTAQPKRPTRPLLSPYSVSTAVVVPSIPPSLHYRPALIARHPASPSPIRPFAHSARPTLSSNGRTTLCPPPDLLDYTP
jgi:hypothetical protein